MLSRRLIVKCSQDFVDRALSVKMLNIICKDHGSCVGEEKEGGFQNDELMMIEHTGSYI